MKRGVEGNDEPADQHRTEVRSKFNPVRPHEGLIVWQRAVDLVACVYELTKKLPATEDYGIKAQMKRSVASVVANIAEGNGRFTKRAYGNFVSIARGSLMETKSYLAISVRVGYLKQADVKQAFDLITQVDNMLTALRTWLQRR
jgi:four helix bundle protein